MTERSIQNSDIISFYNIIIEYNNIPIDAEIKFALLENMFKLDLRILQNFYKIGIRALF